MIREIRHALPPATSSIAEVHATSKLALENAWLPLHGGNNTLSAIYDSIKLLIVESVEIIIWGCNSNSDKQIDLKNYNSSMYAEGVSLSALFSTVTHS